MKSTGLKGQSPKLYKKKTHRQTRPQIAWRGNQIGKFFSEELYVEFTDIFAQIYPPQHDDCTQKGGAS